MRKPLVSPLSLHKNTPYAFCDRVRSRKFSFRSKGKFMFYFPNVQKRQAISFSSFPDLIAYVFSISQKSKKGKSGAM